MSEPGRPDPEALLRRVMEKDESRPRRGRLKVFFGATAGVGKTYAMLEAAKAAKAEGRDLVIGWVETHGRRETAALLDGLERLPAQEVEYRGIRLGEFDLDGALARRPALLLLDELAHSNAPGSRHAKRWQDVEELLDAGIDVYTTLNVQHLESLNDLVTRITDVPIRETVPDRVLEEAAEVEVIDLPPDDLLQRLREGKVYVPEQAARAVERFFRKGNLIALRELALRRTAAHVDARMRDYRRDHEIAETWPVAERILVCVRPHPGTARLIRATRRMAASLGAEWIAAYVESTSQPPLSAPERVHLEAAMRLAEQLGGETTVLTGTTVAESLVDYARRHNVSKIVAGKPSHGRWRDRLRGSLLDEIVRASGDVDVYVISGEREEATPARGWGLPGRRSGGPQYAAALATVLGCSLLCWAMSGRFDNSNLVMVYLAGVAWVATRLGRGPALLASLLSVAAFDFLFVQPFLTFAVADTQYVVTFAIMLAVALTISTLAARVRRQADAATAREERTRALYAASRELAGLTAPDEIAVAAARRVSELFGGTAAVLVAADGKLAAVDDPGRALLADTREGAVAAWVHQHGRPAGRGTETLPGAGAVHIPLGDGRGTVGVVAVRTPRPLTVEEMDVLETIARLVAAPLVRARLTREAEEARLVAERERLRGTLLSSVSHDLRTPLAAITGAASSLLEGGELPDAQQKELQRTILEESQRLDRRVSNLLEMTRLESGHVDLRRDWHSLEEIVGGALSRLDRVLATHHVETSLGADLPLLHVDAVLIEQLLMNLLENAAKYTPSGSTVRVAARRLGNAVELDVEDDGPGLPPGSEERVFEKFHRERTAGRGGFGLGLAICRAVATAHGGSMEARNRQPRGVVFRATLPVPEQAPAQVPGEADV